MKIQYLGTAAAEGIPAMFCECEVCKKVMERGGRSIRTRSQALVDDTVLIDFPADTYMHYLVHRFPLYKIKSCLITHSHMDHLYERDIEMRIDGFSNLKDKEMPLTFYSDVSGYEMIQKEITKHNIKEAKAELIRVYEPFDVEGYEVTALRAFHDPASTPVVYIVEKDGKSLFYSNDTSEYPEEGMQYLRSLKKPLNLVSLNCTGVCDTGTYTGHMNFGRCVALKDLMIKEGIADENTIFVLNHFSHNYPPALYDDLAKLAAKEDMLVSYDGMVIEF